MSYDRLAPLKNFVILGKPAHEFDFSACTSKQQIYDWCDAYWTEFNEKVGNHPLYEDIKSFSDIFGEDFETSRMHVLEKIGDAENLVKPVVVNGEEFTAITKFKVYHCGWECDAEGSVVDTPEGRKLVLSNHGQNYFASADSLKGFITEYCEAIDAMELAQTLLAE